MAFFPVFFRGREHYSIENLKQFLNLGLFQLFLQHDLPEIAAQKKVIKSVIGQVKELGKWDFRSRFFW